MKKYDKGKVIVTTSSFGEYDRCPIELCEKEGFRVILNPYRRKITPEELVVLGRGASGLIAGTETITKDLMLKLPSLRVISRCGSGLDNVDIRAARNLGIRIFNTPDAPVLAVAELTVGLVLNLLRKINMMDRDVKNGKWKKLMGSLVYGKRIGIIGFGKIGKKTAQLLKPFGCKIKYFDPHVKSRAMGFERLSLRKLLSWADIITIHASTNKEIIGKREIGVMRRGAWLLNLSRGEAVNEHAVFEALEKKILSGVALDVFSREPYSGMLIQQDNAILTPHIGSYAIEARIEMEIQAAKNLLKGLKEKKETRI